MYHRDKQVLKLLQKNMRSNYDHQILILRYFLKYLQESTVLWDWEVNAYAKSINDGWRIVGSVPSPIDYTHLFKQNKLRRDWYYSTEPGSTNKFNEEEQLKLKSIFNLKI